MEQDQAETQRHAAFRRERMLASGLLREPEPALPEPSLPEPPLPEPRRAIARPLLVAHPAAPAIAAAVAAAAAPPPPALARIALAAALTPAG